MMNKTLSRTLASILAAVMLLTLATPVLGAQQEEVIRIRNADDLMELAEDCRLDTWSVGKKVILEADISLEGADFEPIPTFGGTFDGNGHTISGIAVLDGTDPAGLFGVLQRSAVVKNLTVEALVAPAGDAKNAGGIVGENYGMVKNCHFEGTVTGKENIGGIAGVNGLTGAISECTAAGLVIGESMTGGIAGQNKGLMTGCENKAQVNTVSVDPTVSLEDLNANLLMDISKWTSLDTSTAAMDTGGIAGYSSGTVLSCVNSGQIGYPHVGYNVGGIIGRSCGHLANCQNHGAVFGRKEVGGVVGQMEPHISLNLSTDYIAQLKTEFDALHQLIGNAANHADNESAVISSRLDTLGGLVGSATDSAKELSDQIVDLGEETVNEINRGSAILDETISQLSGITGQLPGLSEKIEQGFQQLQIAALVMADASRLGTAALQDMKLAAEDAASAVSVSRAAAGKISAGLDELERALTVADKDAVKAALQGIADGLSELTGAVSDMSDAADVLIAVLQNAGWTEDGTKHLRELSASLQDTGAYLTDIHNAVTVIQNNVDVDWEKFTQGCELLLEALGHFVTASRELDEALALAESGIGDISAGISLLTEAVNVKDAAKLRAGIALVTEGFAELAEAIQSASDAMQTLSDALSGIDGLDELIGNMSAVREAVGNLASAGQQAATALGSISEGLALIGENVEIDPETAEQGAALVAQGLDTLQKSISKLREAGSALSAGLAALQDGLAALDEAIDVQDANAIRTALDDIHTTLGKMAEEVSRMSALLGAMADTLEEMQMWGETLVSATEQMAAAFSSFSDALTKIQGGVDTLRENVSLDLDSATEGLKEVREGMQMLTSASTELENAIGHLCDGITDMESASGRLTDALRILAGAMGTFEDVSEDMTDILRDVKALLDYLDGADPIQIPLPGEEVSKTADALYAYITDIEEQLSRLNQDAAVASETLTEDIRAINDQFSKISDTLVDAIYHTEKAVSGDVLYDISEEALATVTDGKALLCTNDAYVEGDINIGGIVGAIATENELDPEDDLSPDFSLYQYQSYDLSAVVQRCINSGTVMAKRSHAGGIVGQMDLGLAVSCENYGSVTSESGDYVGGIAGITGAKIQGCFAKCSLSGRKYVGGIAGSGAAGTLGGTVSSISGCYSMVEIVSGTKYLGAISGGNTGEFSENYFVSDSLAGINRISYSGKAEPIRYDALLELRELPENFQKLTIQFVADGKVLKTILADFGQSFDGSIFPSIPAKEGHWAVWDRAELAGLRFDAVISAVYTPYVTALPSKDTRTNGRPIFLLEGQFDDTASIKAEIMPSTPAAFAHISTTWQEALKRGFTEGVLYREVAEQWKLQLPDDSAESHTVRYLPPEEKAEQLTVFVKRGGIWQEIESQVIGSYLVFTLTGTEAEIAILSCSDARWMRLIPLAIVMLLTLALISVIKRIRRRQKAKRHIQASQKASAAKPDDANTENM